MNVVMIVCAVLLTGALAGAIYRAERGPSMLDRTIALDVVTTTLVSFVGLEAAYSRRIDTIPVLVVLSLVGFVGSVTIARFASREPQGEGKVRTREEIALEEAARAEADAAANAVGDDAEHHGGFAPGEVR